MDLDYLALSLRRDSGLRNRPRGINGLRERAMARFDLPEGDLKAANSDEPVTAGTLAVESATLSESQAQDAARDPDILIAPVMPVAMIRPQWLGDGGIDALGLAFAEKASWGVEAVRADRSAMTGQGVTVAVLDTGIDVSHPAFAGVTIVGQDFTGGGSFADKNGHGTHCAGTIFGRDVNGVRIGVARGVTNAVIGKVLDDQGRGSTTAVLKALHWASTRGANVVSMSLGFNFPAMQEQLALAGLPAMLATSIALKAYRENLAMFDALLTFLMLETPNNAGMVVVAASGNESMRQTNPNFVIDTSVPAASSRDIISVGAVSRAAKDEFDIADFSNTNPVICAPGGDIVSAVPGGELMSMSSTSSASAHVAGLAAQWWQWTLAKFGTVSGASVRAKMLAAADSVRFVDRVTPADRGTGLALAPVERLFEAPHAEVLEPFVISETLEHQPAEDRRLTDTLTSLADQPGPNQHSRRSTKTDAYLSHAIAALPPDRFLESLGAESTTSAAVWLPVLLRVDPIGFDPSRFDGLDVKSRLGEIIAAVAKLETIGLLENDPTVKSLESSRALAGEVANSVPFARADHVHRPPMNEDGASALVAIIDDGVDVLHECFTDFAGRTRIEAFWDQGDPTGLSPSDQGFSSGLNFGTMHTGADMASWISSGTVPANLGRNVGGHGTHVASIAAGKSAGAFAGGVAPAARIVVVKPTFEVAAGDPFSIGYSVSHAAALSFIDEIADKLSMPVAVNVSLGMNAGAHDGSSALEAAFDAFAGGGRKPGRVVIKSAGNERGQAGHASVDVMTGALETLQWNAVSPHSGPDNIEVWFDSSDDVRFRIITPAGDSTIWIEAASDHVSGTFGSGERYALTLERFCRDNGDSRLLITMSAPLGGLVSAGTFSLEILGQAIHSSGHLEAWIERNDRRPIRFVSHVDDEITLSIPGTARTVISVASVRSALPLAASSFSSMGPSRDDRRKPEICAPGENIAAALGGTANGVIAKSGTSMAAPHVTGAVALLFSRCAKQGRPIPNAVQVAGALRSTTQNSRGHHTPAFGFGLVDVAAFVEELS